MKSDSRTPRTPTAWRDAPRDDNGARVKLPAKSDFIAHMRAIGRPTTKDLRELRALKKTRGQQDPGTA
jgi:hypothetical protein